MAKQNFLSGGYYGKLGMTVGQRWKNIRTIRSYVIPHNPRTEAQQANRGQFGDCVFYAQVAMQLNYKAPCFNLPNITSWNARMSTARSLQDLGLTELERFPLYPIDMALPYQITGANVTEVIDETHIKVTVDGTLPEAERVLTMLLLLPGTEDWKERLAVCVGANSEEDYSVFTFQLPESLTLSEGMQCRFISCDDTDSTTDLIASSQIELGYTPVDVHTFDTSLRDYSRSGSVFTITFNEPYQNGTNEITLNRVLCVNNGVRGLQDIPTTTLINNNGYFAMVFDCDATDNQNIWAFPSGSAIQIASISTRSSTVIATAESVTVAISSTDLTRTYDNRFASVTRTNGDFVFSYAKTAPTSTSGSGSISIHAVSNGVFVDYTPANYHATKDSVSFTQSYSSEAEIFAFPNGSTVTENLTRISNGVTYTPEYSTAQAISNTSDLVRNLSATPSWSTTDNAFVVSLASGATFSNNVANQSAEITTHNLVWQTKETKSIAFSHSSNKICVTIPDYGNAFIMLNGDGFTIPSATNHIANGVTYVLPSQTISEVKNGTVTLSADDFELSGNFDSDSIALYLECISDKDIFNVDTPSLNLSYSPNSIEVDGEADIYTLAITNKRIIQPASNNDFDIILSGSWSDETSLEEETELSMSILENQMSFTSGSNVWKIPENTDLLIQNNF